MQKADKKYDKYYRIINIVQALVNLTEVTQDPTKSITTVDIVKLSFHWLKYLKADKFLVYQLYHAAGKTEKKMVLTLKLANMWAN